MDFECVGEIFKKVLMEVGRLDLNHRFIYVHSRKVKVLLRMTDHLMPINGYGIRKNRIMNRGGSGGQKKLASKPADLT